MQQAAVAPESTRRPVSRYTLGEEIANSVIHGVGIALAIAGLVVLVVLSARTGDPWKIISAVIYGVTLVFEYTASTLYHALPQPRAKHVFKVLDHAGIYLFIAGSYTPFCLVTLRDAGGWWLFGAVWALAFAGIATEAYWTYRPRWVSSVIYVAMGWLAIFMIRPLAANLPREAIWLMVAGGVTYTLGAVIYAVRRVPYLHAVWHLFVMAASALQFFAILLVVS
jgi:hemolysin III